MALYVIILFVVLLGFFWLILTNPAHKSAAFLTSYGPLILIVLGGLLTFFRRGVIGVPMIVLGFSWWRRSQSTRPVTSSGGRKSTVRSANLEMELDHDTGEMDGTVLTGRMKGTRLSSLNEEEVLSLYQEICSDSDSTALLVSFLDRYHPDWRERADSDSFSEQGSASGFDAMTKQEAYKILGLEPGASQQEIHQAWRRLIKGVHPDGGGSAFLTAKINAARDVLMN
ncbi:MAG: DnaJ domain-containing protein [Desulfobacterales bacterium]|nr:DnaJ domain-containing protein [Desulfobacterales bacterium]